MSQPPKYSYNYPTRPPQQPPGAPPSGQPPRYSYQYGGNPPAMIPGARAPPPPTNPYAAAAVAPSSNPYQSNPYQQGPPPPAAAPPSHAPHGRAPMSQPVYHQAQPPQTHAPIATRPNIVHGYPGHHGPPPAATAQQSPHYQHHHAPPQQMVGVPSGPAPMPYGHGHGASPPVRRGRPIGSRNATRSTNFVPIPDKPNTVVPQRYSRVNSRTRNRVASRQGSRNRLLSKKEEIEKERENENENENEMMNHLKNMDYRKSLSSAIDKTMKQELIRRKKQDISHFMPKEAQIESEDEEEYEDSKRQLVYHNTSDLKPPKRQNKDMTFSIELFAHQIRKARLNDYSLSFDHFSRNLDDSGNDNSIMEPPFKKRRKLNVDSHSQVLNAQNALSRYLDHCDMFRKVFDTNLYEKLDQRYELISNKNNENMTNSICKQIEYWENMDKIESIKEKEFEMNEKLINKDKKQFYKLWNLVDKETLEYNLDQYMAKKECCGNFAMKPKSKSQDISNDNSNDDLNDNLNNNNNNNNNNDNNNGGKPDIVDITNKEWQDSYGLWNSNNNLKRVEYNERAVFKNANKKVFLRL